MKFTTLRNIERGICIGVLCAVFFTLFPFVSFAVDAFTPVKDLINESGKPCKIDQATNQVVCTSTEVNGKTIGIGFISVCEIFERAATFAGDDNKTKAKGLNGGNWSNYVCSELVDAIPVANLKFDGTKGDVLCLQAVKVTDTTFSQPKQITISISDVDTAAQGQKVCNAIAQKRGGEFSALLVLMTFLFSIAQPILIIAGVLTVCFIGLKVMFTSSGSEDAIKKSMKDFEKVLLGFLLLFLIKLFVVLINGAFFVN